MVQMKKININKYLLLIWNNNYKKLKKNLSIKNQYLLIWTDKLNQKNKIELIQKKLIIIIYN